MSLILAKALLGFERNITHLDGHVVSVKRPGTTQPGKPFVAKTARMLIYGVQVTWKYSRAKVYVYLLGDDRFY